MGEFFIRPNWAQKMNISLCKALVLSRSCRKNCKNWKIQGKIEPAAPASLVKEQSQVWGKHSITDEKCFLFHLKSSSCSQGI